METHGRWWVRPLFAVLALALVVTGAAPALAQNASVPVSPEEIWHGDPDRADVALVFNGGAGYVPGLAILDTLASKQFRATFFVMGWWAERHPDELKLIADGGHEIGSHGHSIFDLTQASDAAVRDDLESADAAISAVTGKTTRPLWSPSAGYRDQRVRNIAASLGYRPIYWTLDSGDWTETATADAVYQKVMANVSNGAIVVMHFDSPTTVRSPAAVLPALIDDLRAAGYRLVTVSQLVTGVGPDA